MNLHQNMSTGQARFLNVTALQMSAAAELRRPDQERLFEGAAESCNKLPLAEHTKSQNA